MMMCMIINFVLLSFDVLEHFIKCESVDVFVNILLYWYRLLYRLGWGGYVTKVY